MLPKKKILVVEDNMINRELLIDILEQQYTVIQAENGETALEILKRCKDEIALILLDVMMPVMDGFSFLDQIKSDVELSLIPVIVMTQSNSESDEVAALSHGATDFVPKPYRPQVILHRVASIINLRETAAMVNQFQYDRLTGLYSKEFFYHKVKERLAEDTEQKYLIICSNIENFKLFNDTFGVSAGDRLLREAADAFRKLAGERAICGRSGADRFLCLQERSRMGENRELFRKIENGELGTKVKNVVTKWGVFEITDPSIPVEQMCDRALLAADSIKGQFNQHYAVYDDALRVKLLRERAITEVMEKALAEEQFQIYFQPQYSLSDDDLVGAEALVRWIHPEWGFMSPGEFVPLFEKNGFISRLDQYVWEKVCELLHEWNEKGYSPVPISVNVSRADIYQLDLTETLLRIVEEYGVRPEQLHLELTESAYMENPEQIIHTVKKLRQNGFVIEMDDFGSGYSSLNMLDQMELDVLKLDMKFVQNETAKPLDQGILRFIVNLARWMNLSVVAEGVEKREQLEYLREIGCDYVQGYYFAKPMPEDEFENLLERQLSMCTVISKKLHHRESNFPKLLVVDEDAGFRERVCQLFKDEYQVKEASNVSDALKCMKEVGQEPISLVILSMSLREQGAAKFLNQLRQDLMLWRVPVLATISHPEDASQVTMGMETDDFLCKCHPLCDLHRRVKRLLNMEFYWERERTLQDEAYRDELTGLLNRRGFYNAIRGLRREEFPLAVYLFDLDDLKKVNDWYGHDKGDEMLCFFSDLLRKETRKGDILCRYGGDEFLVILRHIVPVDTIVRKGEEICRGIQEYQLPDEFHASCSGGIALCPVGEKVSADLIRHADMALYQAKRGQKGSCCLWEEEQGM